MTSERSKRSDFLSLIFISKSISKKLLIKKLQKKSNYSNKRRIGRGFKKRRGAYSRKYGTKRYYYGNKRRIFGEQI